MSPIPKDGCRSKRKKYQNKIIANLVLLTSKVRQNQYFRCKAESSEKAISAKSALDKKRSELLASDTIQGKNAETREAKLAQECWPEMATLEAAEAEKRKAAHEADQAGLVVSEIQWLIRNDEATAALVRERII